MINLCPYLHGVPFILHIVYCILYLVQFYAQLYCVTDHHTQLQGNISRLFPKVIYFSTTFHPDEVPKSDILREVPVVFDNQTIQSLMLNSFLYSAAIWSSPKRSLEERLVYLVGTFLSDKADSTDPAPAPASATSTTTITSSTGTSSSATSSAPAPVPAPAALFNYGTVQKRNLDGGCNEYMERIVKMSHLNADDMPIGRPGETLREAPYHTP
jgi:hypothetical protein